MSMIEHSKYMRVALDCAEKGCGRVNPNPMVGAVVVKNGEIIATGYHERYGAPHAEINAFSACRISPEGASLYVTLEPCSHFGKTPPCTDAIIESGVKRVVIGIRDANPLVNGKGVQKLRENGIDVIEGVLEAECRKQNEVYFHYIINKTPFVVMKYAMTMDGKTASYTGESKWITGGEARRRVHQDRRRYSAIMVGVGTVISDDPLLTSRVDDEPLPVNSDDRRQAIVGCNEGDPLPVDHDDSDQSIPSRMDDSNQSIASRMDDSDQFRVACDKEDLLHVDRDDSDRSIASRMDDSDQSIASRMDDSNQSIASRMDDGLPEHNPIRIICDTNLRTPAGSKVVTTARKVRTIIATACTDANKYEPYANAGCAIFIVSKKDGKVDLNELMAELGKVGIDSILLEGGGTLNWSAINSGIVNKVQAYVAPKILGGVSAQSPVAGIGVKTPDRAYLLTNRSITTFSNGDILIETDISKCLQE